MIPFNIEKKDLFVNAHIEPATISILTSQDILRNFTSMNSMSYQEAADFLFARRAQGMKLGLENIRRFLDRLGHPEMNFPSIHIAGTNGKGSTAAILEAVLREAGYRTGLYTSPHLYDMRERIQIRGQFISPAEILRFLNTFKSDIEAADVSFFEILTALAFFHFAENKTEIAVLETGLGGRLDATATVSPVLTMITDIGMDHMHILGNSLESITREKAGIFKPATPCLTCNKNQKVRNVLMKIAGEMNVPLRFSNDLVRTSGIQCSDHGSRFDARTPGTMYHDLHLKLLGSHQIANCGLVLLAVNELREQGWHISEEAVRKGLESVRWRGRLDLLQENPRLLLDSAHNLMGIKSLVKAVVSLFAYDRLILIFGVLADKNYKSMFRQIAPLADRIVLTRPLSDRALDPHRLLDLIPGRRKDIDVIPEIETAWARGVGLAEKSDLVCGAGSIYFIGEVLRIWDQKKHSSCI
jgi:dihydrofolate synthase/folylpolyglutamate synthase